MTQKKAILFFGPSPLVTTGESLSLLQLAKTAISLNYIPFIICYNPQTKPGSMLIKMDVGDNQFVYVQEIQNCNSHEALIAIRKLVIYKQTEIEALICLADFHRFYYALSILKKELDFPVIWNGIHDEEPAPVYYINHYKECFDHIASLTKASAKLFKDASFPSVSNLSYALNQDVFTPLNFTDEERINIRRKYGLFHYDKLFFSNFNNIERKNIPNMLMGFKEHLSHYPSNGLLLKTHPNQIGGCDIVYMVDELKLNGNVSIIDSNTKNTMQTKELAILYNISDFYLQTAYSEGFGLPIAEAHLCGIPVIAPLTGGIVEQEPEVIIESTKYATSAVGSTSMMFKHLSSPKQIADALNNAMTAQLPSPQDMRQKALQYNKTDQQKDLAATLTQARSAFAQAKLNSKTKRVNQN